MAQVLLTDLKKSYGTVELFDGVDLEISHGEFVVFVGPSGSGKSTLLRMIAGLESVTDGVIEIDGEDVTYEDPSDRGIAMVFQNYALYPHMDVFGNIAFNLRLSGLPKAEVNERVREAARILRLEDLLGRSPAQLSGGQRQRVAIGRAIVRKPKVFLFDEPLSNLDAALRVATRLEIARLHERLGSTMVYVTHDQVEAMTLADKIVVLRDGRIEQVGSPIDLYNAPQNSFVAGFIGSPKMNFFSPSEVNGSSAGAGQSVGLRPEHLTQCDASQAVVSGKMELVEHLGEYALVHLSTAAGTEFIAKIEDTPHFERGQELHFTAPAERTHVFDEKGLRV